VPTKPANKDQPKKEPQWEGEETNPEGQGEAPQTEETPRGERKHKEGTTHQHIFFKHKQRAKHHLIGNFYRYRGHYE